MASDDAPIEQVWRQQPQERQTMSLDEIRTKATEFDRKVKQWGLVGGVTMGLLVVKNAWEVWVDTDLIERAGDLLFLAGLLVVVYRFSRYARANAAPAVLGQTSCLEHYRAQLIRQHELSREGWTYVLPFAPGLGLIIVGRMMEGRPPTQVAAMIAIAVATLLGALWVIARNRRALERDIAALD